MPGSPELTHLHNLQMFSIVGSPITDIGLAHSAGASQFVEFELTLPARGLPTRAWQALLGWSTCGSPFSRTQTLAMGACVIWARSAMSRSIDAHSIARSGDRVCSELAKNRQFTCLCGHGMRVTDAGLAELKSLRKD